MTPQHLDRIARTYGKPMQEQNAEIQYLFNAEGLGAMLSPQDDLLAALKALMALDVKGHALADRLQFSDSGRALLAQCRAAIARATKEA